MNWAVVRSSSVLGSPQRVPEVSPSWPQACSFGRTMFILFHCLVLELQFKAIRPRTLINPRGDPVPLAGGYKPSIK